MCSNRQGSKLFLPSMGSSSHGYSDSENSKPLENGGITNLNSGDDGSDKCTGDSCPSDCESAVSGPENERQVVDDGLVRIGDGHVVYERIERKLFSGLSVYGFNVVKVEEVHGIDYSAVLRRAKLHSFHIYAKATETSRCGDANVKHAWYGASKDEIMGIISNGFGLPTNAGTNGLGVYLAPFDCPIESLRLSASEEDGLRHVLLCRVILGKTEVVCPGSGQSNPSSEEFDSGVDDLVTPQKYVIWNSRVNTHILPELLVSFRVSSGLQPQRKSKSDWMSFATLVTVLSKYLPPDAVESITKHHDDYKRKMIKRTEMIDKVRRIAGDKLLMAIVKRYGEK